MSIDKDSQEELFIEIKELQGFLLEDSTKDQQGIIGVTLHGSSNSEEVKIFLPGRQNFFY